MHRRFLTLVIVASFFGIPPPLVQANTTRVDPALFAGLHWRSIGPFRGGRSTSASGVPGDARTYYFGAVGGGVWKTQNAGLTWFPIMDGEPVSSIGALAVAPSDPNTVYVGSGEADMRSDIIHGNGMYRSTDAGATWTHIGLDDSRQIGRILVDPRDPKTLLVAALGHAYGPNDMRGVYRSTDAGATWTRTLFKDADTGAIDLAATPNGDVVYASLWQTRRPPWNTYPPSNGPGTGLYVSHDRGVTWAPLQGNGFPSEGLGKIGLAVAPSEPSRVYAIVDAKAGGLYRSDDAGATWRRMNDDQRLWDRGWYFCHIAVDPKDADLVYVSDTSVYRSKDGGSHVEAIKGSPDGDDFHQLWIDPTDGAHLALASDQGTSVSMDRAATWSSWFNQPTGQFYHVAADGTFPYHLYGAQQDSGAARIVSRSNHAGIEERDWEPIVAGGESGYIAPDPNDGNVIYGDTVTREDLRTHQFLNMSPTAGFPGPWRDEWTLPLVFGPGGHELYFAHQQIFRWSTLSGWTTMSGDLTRAEAGTPSTLDPVTARDAASGEPRGVVYAIAPSPRDPKIVWAGTDDGLVHLTTQAGPDHSGATVMKSWRDVTPPALTPWTHVSSIEASHVDPATAYVAAERHRLDDDRPYLYITHDFGKTWKSATTGIPDGSFINAIREDPQRRGLLYAATETGVYVSFDDGEGWQSLRLDMPIVSVRDLVVHDDDLAIATHGRAFWILDDIAPLRELAKNASPGTRLFAPTQAIRTRDGNDEAEASPPETPRGANPPNGAYLDYVVPADARGPIVIDILDTSGAPIRHYASDAKPETIDAKDVPFPAYWIPAPVEPTASPGMHRLVWDFHIGDPDGPLAAPGTYRIRMTAPGAPPQTQTLTLRKDPRVAASDADLVQQTQIATRIATAIATARKSIADGTKLREKQPALRAAIDAVIGVSPSNAPDDSIGPQANAAAPSLRREARLLQESFDAIESADARPSARQTLAANLAIANVASGVRALMRITQSALSIPEDHPLEATGRAYAVASDHRLGSQTGMRILEGGGNAVDAAVAIGYTMAVTFPPAGNVGGGGFMLVRLANGATHFIDFRETAPGAATADMYLDAKRQVVPDLSTVGPLSAGVPGTVAGLEYAREHYGTKTRHDLITDAIRYAADGFALDEGDLTYMTRSKDLLLKYPQTSAIFAPGGVLPTPGTVLRQPDLAATLRRIDADGAAGFYQGPVARRLAAAVRAAGGIITEDDLARYEVVDRAPITCPHHGDTIVTSPPPSSGGVAICEVLGILGDPAPGSHLRDVANAHLELEAERRAFADRNTQLGDPAFVPSPVDALLQPAYLSKLRASIDANHATPSTAIHGGGVTAVEGKNTTSYSVADAAGNVVVVTYTLNNLFGSGFTAGDTGVLLNDEMDDFTSLPGAPNMFGLVQGAANAIAPGKRPLSSMSPTVVVDAHGRAVLAVGAAGGPRIITTVLDAVRGVIDFGDDAETALAAKRVHMQWLPDAVYAEAGAYDDATFTALSAMGYAIAPKPAFAAANAVEIDPDRGTKQAAHDPRVPTGAALAR